MSKLKIQRTKMYPLPKHYYFTTNNIFVNYIVEDILNIIKTSKIIQTLPVEIYVIGLFDDIFVYEACLFNEKEKLSININESFRQREHYMFTFIKTLLNLAYREIKPHLLKYKYKW